MQRAGRSAGHFGHALGRAARRRAQQKAQVQVAGHLPVLSLAGFGALWLWPSFGVLVLFQVLRRGLHYAVDRPAREVLYIPLGPEERYKAKPFIDTFIYRGGDLLGVWAPTAFAALAIPVGLAAVGCSGLWLGSSVALGRRVKAVAAAAEG